MTCKPMTRKVEAFEQMVSDLQDVENITVSLGSINTSDWDYIEDQD